MASIEFQMDLKKIGRRIKEARLKKGLTHEGLSATVGLSTVHISHIESGSTKMSLESFARICFALEVSPDQILRGCTYTSLEYLRDDIAGMLKQCSEKEMEMFANLLKAYIENRE